jgi:endoglucanase
MISLFLLFILLLTGVGCTMERPPPVPTDAFQYNARLGRGVNLGNALEAPQEGQWGMTLQADYFELIKAAGFDSVRIPIKWSAHAELEPPYTIEAAFFERIDWAIEQAQQNDLTAIINMHHYDEMATDPEAHTARFVGLWSQIAAHYQAAPNTVYFELINEPNMALTASRWNALFPQALAVVREMNPTRPVIIGPARWNNIDQLGLLELPEEDQYLIVSFHYYLPFEFTHQGAEWIDNSEGWLGRTWEGDPFEQQSIRNDLDLAAAWAAEHHRPLFMGEFGAYSRAEMDSRVRWTEFLRSEAELRDISWAYWEFGAGFGVYNRGTKRWREPLLGALIPPETVE